MIWQLAVIGFGLAMNNALGSVALGAMRMNRLVQLRIAVIFALCEAAMPIVGMLIGEQIASILGNHTRYIGIGILVVLGVYLILKRDSEDNANTSVPSGFYTILLAITLSLDNLTVGFGLGVLGFSMVTAGVMFGTISLLMTLAGLEVGRLVGQKVNVPADKLSGAVLVLTGILMAV